MKAALLALGLALAAPVSAAAELARIEAAFTPGDDIEGLVVRTIGRARKQVQVQAYLFTNRRIALALVEARRRGVGVEVIGDAAQQAAGGLPYLDRLHRAGARIYLDERAGASHNKIVIVDAGSAAAAVVTGSYNFTHAAQSRNAENVVVISGNRAIIARFAENFRNQREQARPWP